MPAPIPASPALAYFQSSLAVVYLLASEAWRQELARRAVADDADPYSDADPYGDEGETGAHL